MTDQPTATSPASSPAPGTATQEDPMTDTTTTPPLAGPGDQRTFTSADRDRLLIARQETLQFEDFLLRRFQAFVRAGHAVPQSPRHRGEPMNRDAAEGTISRGRLRLPNGWTTYQATWDQEDKPVVLKPFTADDRGPGSYGPTVDMPWAWVWGDTEREDRYATYLALREEFEGPQV